jgi:hypothetical protein
MNDEELRRRYQDGMQKRTAGAEETPDPELLLRVARGEATEAERLRILDVVMQSEELRREYDTYRALAAGARTPSARWPHWLAAAVVLIVAGGAMFWGMSRTNEDVWRGGEGLLELVAPAQDAAVTPPVTLEWRAAPGAHAYAVELLADDGRPVALYETADTIQVVADSAWLLPGARYRWTVTARLPDGASARSALRSFSLRP